MPLGQFNRLRYLGPTAHVRFVLLLTMLLSVNLPLYAMSEAAPEKSFEQIRQEALQVSSDEVQTVRYRWLLRFWRAEYQVLLDVDHLESEMARSEDGGTDHPRFDFDEMLELTRWYFQRDLIAEIRRTNPSVDKQEFLILLLEHVLTGTTQKTMAAYELNMKAEKYQNKYNPNPELASFVSRRIMIPLPPLSWTVGFSVRGGIGFVGDLGEYRLMGAEVPVRYKRLIARMAVDWGWGNPPNPDEGGARMFAGVTLGYHFIKGKQWALYPSFGGGIVRIAYGDPVVFSPAIVGSTILEVLGFTIGVEYRHLASRHRFATTELLVLATLPFVYHSFPQGGFDSR